MSEDGVISMKIESSNLKTDPRSNGSTALQNVDEHLANALDKSEQVISSYSKREDKRKLPNILPNTVTSTEKCRKSHLLRRDKKQDECGSDSSDSAFESKDDIIFPTSPKPNWTHIRHPLKKTKNVRSTSPEHHKHVPHVWSLNYVQNEGCNAGHLMYKKTTSPEASPNGPHTDLASETSFSSPPQYIHLERNNSRVIIHHGNKHTQTCENIIADINYTTKGYSVRVPVLDRVGCMSCGCWSHLEPHQKKSKYNLNKNVLDKIHQDDSTAGIEIMSNKYGVLKCNMVPTTPGGSNSTFSDLNNNTTPTKTPTRRLPSPPPFPSPVFDCTDHSGSESINLLLQGKCSVRSPTISSYDSKSHSIPASMSDYTNVSNKTIIGKNTILQDKQQQPIAILVCAPNSSSDDVPEKQNQPTNHQNEQQISSYQETDHKQNAAVIVSSVLRASIASVAKPPTPLTSTPLTAPTTSTVLMTLPEEFELSPDKPDVTSSAHVISSVIPPHQKSLDDNIKSLKPSISTTKENTEEKIKETAKKETTKEKEVTPCAPDLTEDVSEDVDTLAPLPFPQHSRLTKSEHPSSSLLSDNPSHKVSEKSVKDPASLTRPISTTKSKTEEDHITQTSPNRPTLTSRSGSEESKASTMKWKKAGLLLKTGLTFKDAGRIQQLKKMYYQVKRDSITYFHALAKDNVCDDEDPFILQHFNTNEKKPDKRRSSLDARAIPDSESFIIDPAGDLYFLTQGLVTIAMLFNLVSSILRMSFYEVENEMGVELFILESSFDMVYLFDFFIHFRTGFLDDGILVTDLERIKNNYMKNDYFTYDVLSVVPLCISYGLAKAFGMLLLGIVTRGPLFEDGMVYSVVTGEAVLRVAKLAKFFSMRRFFDMFGSRTNSPGMMRALCLILYLLLSIHWVGCLYYCISEHEGFGINDWVFPLYPEGDYNNQFYRKYIQCFYWAFLTLTTIGGPEQPITTLEYIVTCITFLLGIFIFAAVVGNVGDAITSMNESKTSYQKRADAIKLYMQHHGVPDVLQKKVKKWLEYSWMRTQGADEQSLMDALPERLRARIAIQIHVKTLKKVKIFENCEHGLLCELVLKLRPQIFSPGDYICRIGEIGKEMFIICHGKVECIITLPNGERKTVAVLEAGKSFGEIALLGVEGCSRRTADVRSIGYSELLSLSKKALTQALEDYPEARNQLEAEGKNRLGKGSSKQMPHKYQREGESDDSDTDGRKGSPDNKTLSKLLEDLKSFDSVKYNKTVQNLELEKESLQDKLDKKIAELDEANRLIKQFSNDKKYITLRTVNDITSRYKLTQNGKADKFLHTEDS